MLKYAALIALLVGCHSKEDRDKQELVDLLKSKGIDVSTEPPGSGEHGDPPATPFHSADGRYDVAFPTGAPKEAVKTDPNGIAWHEAADPTGAAFVQYTDLASHADALTVAKEFKASADPTKIRHDELATVDGHDQRDLEVELSSADRRLWMRFVVVDKRVYKVGVAPPGADSVLATGFLKTFHPG